MLLLVTTLKNCNIPEEGESSSKWNSAAKHWYANTVILGPHGLYFKLMVPKSHPGPVSSDLFAYFHDLTLIRFIAKNSHYISLYEPDIFVSDYNIKSMDEDI